MKAATVLSSAVLLASCVVNPDADRELRNESRRADTMDAAPGVLAPAPDTGQHGMPVAKPTAPVESGMPVVNPTDSGRQPL